MARLIRHGRRPIAVLAMSSAMALALSACGTHPSAGSPSGSADSYKVGFILQLSGAGSVYADHAQAGSKAGFEDVNKHNKAGVRFTSMVADAGADARSANTACSRLIQQQKAQAIVAFIPGPQLLACNALAKRLDIPLLSLSSGAGNICAWNLTSLGLVPNQQTLPAIDELVAEGKKRWYFLGANYSTPKASIGTAKEHLTKLGGTVVGTAYEPSGTADFSQDIANIVKARPDVAFLNVIGDDDVALQKQWAADPRTKGITRVDVLLGEGTAKALGAAAEESGRPASTSPPSRETATTPSRNWPSEAVSRARRTSTHMCRTCRCRHSPPRSSSPGPMGGTSSRRSGTQTLTARSAPSSP